MMQINSQNSQLVNLTRQDINSGYQTHSNTDLNSFKEITGTSTEKLVTPKHYYTVNGKNWAIEESIHFKCQAVADDINPYGYTLEVRWKDTKGEWYGWTTYWNHKIYHSIHQANEAALKCHLSKNSIYEWRIKPLYVMDQMEFRNFKLDKLLSDNKPDSKKYEIKGWKVKEDVEIEYNNGNKFKYKKGTLFIQLENGSIFRVNKPSDPTSIGDHYQLKHNLIPNKQVVEVDILDEKWSHPHLIKELKLKFKLK